MLPFDIACRLIPGYELLSVFERSDFEKSEAGKVLFETINKIKDAIQEEKSSWFFSKTKETSEQTIQERKEFLFSENGISDSPEYIRLSNQIFIKIVQTHYSEIALLSKEQQLALADAEFSQLIKAELFSLYEKRAEAGKQYAKAYIGLETGRQVKHYDIEIKVKLNQWYDELSTQPKLASFKNALVNKKIEARSEELAKIFPLFNDPLYREQFRILNKNLAKEKSASLAEEEALASLLLDHLKVNVASEYNHINFDAINEAQASSLARQILAAADKKLAFDKEKWLTDYKNALKKHIFDQLTTVEVMEWTNNEKTLTESLSYLWQQLRNKTHTAESLTKLVKRMGDAHMFFANLNLGAQSDSPYGAVMDVVNAARYGEQISEFKSIVKGLMKPFSPLYYEYKEIALYERNYLFKVVRTLIPLVIVAAVMVGVAAALAPLILPDLAFLAALIPAFFVGLVIATQYVNIKNFIGKGYNYARQYFAGGPFETREYQASKRMIEIFGEKLAVEIRDIYINEIKSCDEHARTSIEERDANKMLRLSLYLEWYDIRNNNDLKPAQVRALVMDRLLELSKKEQKDLTTNLRANLEKGIDEQLDVMMEELDSTFNLVYRKNDEYFDTAENENELFEYFDTAENDNEFFEYFDTVQNFEELSSSENDDQKPVALNMGNFNDISSYKESTVILIKENKQPKGPSFYSGDEEEYKQNIDIDENFNSYDQDFFSVQPKPQKKLALGDNAASFFNAKIKINQLNKTSNKIYQQNEDAHRLNH